VRTTRRYVPIALLVFIVYIVFSGSVSPYDIAIGVALAIAVSALTTRFLVSDGGKAMSFRRFANLVKYALYYLTVAEFKAHSLVIRIILSRDMPVRPAIVRVPYRARNPYTIVGSANSITNTPGTVVVDLDTGRSLFYVHWIYVIGLDPETTYREILKDFEEGLSKVFE
jgi:multicomponent Na+:H+ antiporter subunit E